VLLVGERVRLYYRELLAALDFSKHIKSLRQKFGLSQQQFANLINIPVPLVKQWERGQVQPPARYRQQIVMAEAMGVQALYKVGADSNGSLLHEPGITYFLEQEITPTIDFSTDPEIVRTVVEGERLTYGHLFNPAFADEILLIDPLPHQHLAVYDHMLKQTRLRFLLADDTGETIMTGLYPPVEFQM
jgi:transcriptional regulator with XRE-family HTH domain